MKFCRVLKILLDGCQKKVAWSDLTRMRTSSRRLQVVCFKCKASAPSWIHEKLHFHSMKHCECLQNSWQTPSHPLFLKKSVGREGKFSYDNASTDNKPLLSCFTIHLLLNLILKVIWLAILNTHVNLHDSIFDIFFIFKKHLFFPF